MIGKLVLKALQAVLLPFFFFPVLFIIDPPPGAPRLAWAIVAALALGGIYGCELLIRRLQVKQNIDNRLDKITGRTGIVIIRRRF